MNVFKRVRMSGTGQEKLEESLSFVENHVQQVLMDPVDPENTPCLMSVALDSEGFPMSKRTTEGTYVNFLKMDLIEPYFSEVDRNSYHVSFDMESLLVPNEAAAAVLKTGLCLMQGEEYYIFSESALVDLGSFLDTHGTLLTQNSLARNLVLAEKFQQEKSIGLLTAHDTGPYHLILSVLKPKNLYTPLRESLEFCVDNIVGELELVSWEMSLEAVRMIYKPHLRAKGTRENWFVEIYASSLSREATVIRKLVRINDAYVCIGRVQVPVRYKREKFSLSGFYHTYPAFEKALEKLDRTINMDSCMQVHGNDPEQIAEKLLACAGLMDKDKKFPKKLLAKMEQQLTDQIWLMEGNESLTSFFSMTVKALDAVKGEVTGECFEKAQESLSKMPRQIDAAFKQFRASDVEKQPMLYDLFAEEDAS